MRYFCADFCADFAPILAFCADFAPIFDPKSWSQTKKLDLVLLKRKNRKPLYLLGISDFSWVGARTDSDFLPKFQEISKRFKLLNINSLSKNYTCRHIS